jgi:drug/metabolite transporter (DMT)-like permease
MLSPTPNPMRGIALKLSSVAVFVVMSALIKASGQVPPGQIAFFRSFFAIFPILGFLAFNGQLKTAFKTSYPIGHFWRGIVGVAAMVCGFYALTQLPLPEVTAFGFASPLFVVLLSAIFLHEKVRLYRWSAVMAGLVGVLIISWPRLTVFASPESSVATLGAIAAIAGAFLAAVAMLIVRRLVKVEETQTIVLWFSLSATVIALLSYPFGWISLNPQQAMLLIAAGMVGGVAQILLTESYRHAEASVLAPFEYASIIIATMFGFLIFGEIPTAWTLSGAAIVIASGVFITWREHKLGLERGPVKAATPPQN